MYVLQSTLNGTLRLWDYAEAGPGACVRTYKGHANVRYCSFAAFGVHDGCVVCGGEDGRVTLWDLQSCAVLQTLRHAEGGSEGGEATGGGGAEGAPEGAPEAVVVALDVHPTRRLLASGALDSDRTVVIWTAEEKGDVMVQ